jgi:hypothetical protein
MAGLRKIGWLDADGGQEVWRGLMSGRAGSSHRLGATTSCFISRSGHGGSQGDVNISLGLFDHIPTAIPDESSFAMLLVG